MCLEVAEILPFTPRLRKATPTQCTANPSLKSKFNGVAAQVDCSIVATTTKKNFCVPKMPPRHATKFPA